MSSTYTICDTASESHSDVSSCPVVSILIFFSIFDSTGS
jgi:hypothetical protein